MNQRRTLADIEREIHATQAEMDMTVDALRRKLSPGELFGQTFGYLRDSGTNAGRTFMGQIRDRPVPLAMLAASLAWLMMSEGGTRRREREISERPGERRGRQPDRDFDETDYRTVTQYGNVFRALASVRPRIEETGEEFGNRLYPAIAEALGVKQEPAERPERFRARIERAFDELSSRAEDVQHRLSEQTRTQWRRTRASAREAVETARHRAREVGDRAAYGARRAGEQAADTFEHYPLAVGALAMALGAFIGAALPATRREREWIGRTGEDLRETAGAYAREAAHAAGDVAERMASAARERAEKEHLTPEEAERRAADVADRLRRTGEEAIEAGREEAERKIRGTGGGPST